MRNSSLHFRVGTRSSKLAHVQTAAALKALEIHFPQVAFEVVPLTSPGDRDLHTDLRNSPSDFFTRDLDDALRNGTIDMALHSAKDLPDPLPVDLESFWLPVREDPRDVLVRPAGTPADAPWPENPRVGVSSARREQWCRQRFPASSCRSIRGTIEKRLEQLDTGDYDLLIMAAAALIRLDLTGRIAEWIPADALELPEGQGVLAATFAAGNMRLRALRSLFVKSVVFAGAGIGHAGTCTLETIDALKRADVCLHDTLLDPALLKHLPPRARRLDVGKRCGERGAGQDRINQMLVQYACRGARVVRLKGGDPGIYGRLAEEVETLAAHSLPFHVLPGISSLQLATTATGMLVTRRGESRGFCVLTPRAGGGAVESIGAAIRTALPQIYFMATTAAGTVCRELLEEGTPPQTPVAFVYEAGTPWESIQQSTLEHTAAHPPPVEKPPRAGLLLIGEAAAHRYPVSHGALGGRRVLLTCSETLQSKACSLIRDYGGIPLPCPAIRLTPVPEGIVRLQQQPPFDWLVLTSPSAVHAAIMLVKDAGIDLRTLPKIITCGKGSAAALRQHGLHPAALPFSDYGAEALLATARLSLTPGDRVLRLRSDAAGTALAEGLRTLGMQVEDQIILRNEPMQTAVIPPFDAVFFASGSAVRALLDQDPVPSLKGCLVAAMGGPTASELSRRGIAPVITAHEATLPAALEALAAAALADKLQAVNTR